MLQARPRPDRVWWPDICPEDRGRLRWEHRQVQAESEEQNFPTPGGEDGEFPERKEQGENPELGDDPDGSDDHRCETRVLKISDKTFRASGDPKRRLSWSGMTTSESS